MDTKYANACTEVLTLFEYFLDEDDYKIIPKEQIDYMKKISNPKYIFTVDTTKELEEQEVSKEGKAIILSLFKKYFATPEQRRKLDSFIRSKTDNKDSNSLGAPVYKSLEEIHEAKKAHANNEKEKPTNSLVKKESFWVKFYNKILALIHKK